MPSRGRCTRTLPAPIIENYQWQERGNCRGIKDPDVFFLPYNARTTTKQKLIQKAKAVCVGCPVIDDCLEFALETQEVYGVWGGKSEEERLEILRKRGVKINVAE